MDQNNLVLYTDGSFYPIPGSPTDGFYGSGVHGYIYNTSTIGQKPKSGNTPSEHTITTKGYVKNDKYKQNDTRKTVSPSHYIEASYSYQNKGNNVISELKAVISVLIDLKEKILPTIPLNEILIIADSKYVLYCLNLIEDDKFKYKLEDDQQKNIELIRELNDLVTWYKENGINIRYSKIEAHSGNIGNNLADRLALYGRNRSISRESGSVFHLRDANSYWNTQQERHPFLRYKQMFITNSIEAPSDRNIYSIMEYSSSTEPGRKTHDACFGLVVLKEDQSFIEDTIKFYQNLVFKMGTMLGNMSPVHTLDLNNLFSRNNIYYYKLFGSNALNFIPRNKQLQTFDGRPLIYNINPAGLALQALERMQSLYKILDDYECDKKPNNIEYFDITNNIYNIELSKKNDNIYKIIPENGQNSIKIDVDIGRPIKLLLDLGKDTLSRNQFKALETYKPKVVLVMEKHPSSKEEIAIYNYYTIVKTEQGDIGIFCNFYSGKIIVDMTPSKG